MHASVYAATSLDGFIAREDGRVDWLDKADPGDGEYGFDDLLSSVDALVMGRNTFDFVLGTGEWAYGDKPVFVLTHRQLDLPTPFAGRVEALQIATDSIAEEFDRRGVEHVYVDGGETVQSFIRAQLVTRIIITRIPILIGSGIPLFGPVDSDIDLRLIRSQAFENGWIQDEYEVVS